VAVRKFRKIKKIQKIGKSLECFPRLQLLPISVILTLGVSHNQSGQETKALYSLLEEGWEIDQITTA
jgi:hypothetical protein